MSSLNFASRPPGSGGDSSIAGSEGAPPTPDAQSEWRTNWPSVVAAAFGMSCTTLYFYSAGTFVGPIERETGWTRAEIGSGLTVVTLIYAALGPLVGLGIDRYGARKMAIAAMIMFPLAFGMLGMTGPSLWSWWFHWALLGLIGFPVFPATWTAPITRLFNRSRGLALAITLSGMSAGSIVTPLLANLLIESFGWRAAYPLLALIWAGIGLPLVYFLLKDGHGPTKVARAVPFPHQELYGAPQPRVRDSILSYQYLAIVVAVSLFTFVMNSFVFSLVPILVWQGLTASHAAQLASLFGITAVLGRLITGVLLDRFDAKRIIAVVMTLPIFASTLLFLSHGTVGSAAVAILLMGFALGAEIDGIAYLISRCFHPSHNGLLFATAMSASSAATSLAPLFSGWVYDTTGGYSRLLLLMIFPCLVSALAIASLRRPGREPGIA